MRRMTTALIGAAALTGVMGAAVSARAQRISNVDGNRLLAVCSGDSLIGCDAYIGGIADAAATYQSMGQGPGAPMRVPPLICVPTQVTGVQLRQVTLDSLRSHPQDLHQAAGLLVLRALHHAYPCRSGNPT